MLPLEVKMQEELQWNSIWIKLPKQLKISDHFALEKEESEKVESHYIIKGHHSTELSLNLWLKEETSLLETEQVESQSMA